MAAGNSQAAAAQRRKRFIAAYLQNGNNATEAAKSAGFSAKTAYSAGGRLLKKVDVKEALARAAQAVAEKAGLSVERTLREVARIAYSDPRRFYNPDGSLKEIHELDEDTAATVAQVEIDEIKADGVVIGRTKKLKHWDKNAALEKAMKYHGLYEKDNSQSKPIIVFRSEDAGVL